MDLKRAIHSLAILVSSALSCIPHGPAKAEESSAPKKLRKSLMEAADLSTPSFTLTSQGRDDPPRPGQKYPWRNGIVTTTFWIGENPTKNNPVPNHASSWDVDWAKKYGGTDTPDRSKRTSDYRPAGFSPGQNPFYIALPYNDKMATGHKPEAPDVIPWFKEAYQGPGKSTLKGRWVAIRYKGRVAYAQWEDCGPFRTDHWQYVFGTERPKPNLNKGAGLDVSPAVRDFLGMNDTDVTDWRFCEFDEVPPGPWAKYGENNTFVQVRKKTEQQLAKNRELAAPATAVR
jgi:hypothetical protein